MTGEKIVACVLRSGGIYDAEWVRKLHAGVTEHLSLPHRFVCLSDTDVPCERIPLITDHPGWYAKTELFRPDIFPEGATVLYLDLDTLVLGDPRHLLEWWGGLCMLTDFYEVDRPRSRPASGVMVWNVGTLPASLQDTVLSSNFSPRVRSRMDFWLGPRVQEERIQDLWPGQVVSYKIHAREAPPPDARLVCGHGNPRFSDPAAGWAHRHWRAL